MSSTLLTWPADTISRLNLVEGLLNATGPLRAEEVAAYFAGTTAEAVMPTLLLLVGFGRAEENPDGSYRWVWSSPGVV